MSSSKSPPQVLLVRNQPEESGQETEEHEAISIPEVWVAQDEPYESEQQTEENEVISKPEV